MPQIKVVFSQTLQHKLINEIFFVLKVERAKWLYWQKWNIKLSLKLKAEVNETSTYKVSKKSLGNSNRTLETAFGVTTRTRITEKMCTEQPVANVWAVFHIPAVLLYGESRRRERRTMDATNRGIESYRATK